jgi:tetratricopeptide (TPR) repeat protein
MSNSLSQIKSMLSRGEYDQAESALQHLDMSGSANAESQYLLGTLQHRKNFLVDAVESFRRALLLDPKFVDAAIGLSIIYNDTGRYAEASELYKQAERMAGARSHSPSHSIVLDKEIAQKHIDLGSLYRQVLRFADAAAEFQKALQLDPENVEAKIHMAKCLAQQGSSKQALELMKNLVKERPAQAKLRIQLALLYFSLGNAIDAQVELQQALVLDPGNEEVKMYLAMTSQASISTVS